MAVDGTAHPARMRGVSPGLAPDDVRCLLRLLGECHEIRHAGDDATLHLLQGLAGLTRSQVGLRMDCPRIASDEPPIIDSVSDFGWANAADRDRIYEFMRERPLNADPLSTAVIDADGDLVTRTRSDAVTARAWSRTEIHNEVHRPSRIDDSLLSLSRGPCGRARVLVFKRSCGEPLYGPREREIVHVAHAECAWALAGTTPPDVQLDDDWTPRERQTLDLLLTGASEKSVAAQLGISPHTVHDYVKIIYRRLGVTSRAELMAHAISRSGRTPPGTAARTAPSPR